MSLMLHCGAESVNRDFLKTLPTPLPLGSRHWPTPHSEFVDLVTESLFNHGYQIEDEGFGTTKDGNRFFGLMEVKRQEITPARALEGEYIPKTKGYALNIGLRASHDQTFPKALLVGTRVFVCDNLAFSGEIKVSTRQTINVNRRLPSLIAGAMERIVDLEANQDERFDMYQTAELDHKSGGSELIEMLRRDILTPRTIQQAIKEWDSPTHDEHLNEGRRTVWTLFNAVTEAVKPSDGKQGVTGNAVRTIPLTHMLDDLVGFRVH